MTFHVKNRALFLLGALLVFAGVADSQVYFGGYPSSPTFNKVSIRSPGSGTFVATINSGCSTTPTFNVNYQVVGKIAYLWTNGTSCTANANTFTVSGVPAVVSPSPTATTVSLPVSGFQNAAAPNTAPVDVTINSLGNMSFAISGSLTGWSTTGTHGWNQATTIVYSLD